ncbi:MAG: Holliday junction resolvase RuvX [bacterium]|nr:Holliday junction resolvase RuvX [bacterium]
MRYLGIDYGSKHIGVAVSDDTATLAFPLGSVAAGGEALGEVLALARENGVRQIIIGESRNYSGELNPIMERIEKFKQQLEQAGQTVVYEPEFLTSAQALRQGQDKRGEGGSATLDKDASAAALILQNYLDRKKARPDVE